ncbi:hypothetical protein TRFO_36031 [Tritrichomonas foetus]|uniref:Right handed beta helix domain-containing protein n=1 Tax=Tritrichomonas foetus TaxID=1144522 RepID=A0A1J4JEY7_9EUKA|nr:hypothetical protein TRFO_36031 [Tritrichomonas foetus]|eukprot:OHS97706.1 hypothetical protein TRFO_36031 [Tritrichomonas foetus]
MNYTFLLLTASLHLQSPFFTHQKSFSHATLTFDHIKFGRSFSNFFYSQSSFSKTIFQSAHFSHFLASPVVVDSKTISNQLFYNQGFQFRGGREMTFLNSVFESCSSISMGGGIQLFGNTLDKSNLTISNCLFDSCSAGMQGGAVYALSSRYIISESCFTRCYAKDKQTCSLRGESQFTHLINMTTVYLNGHGTNDMTTFSTSSTVIVITNINSTRNNVENMAAGHYVATNLMCYLKYSTFSDNIGVNVLNIQLRNHESSIEYVNMINNTASIKFTSLIYCNAKTAFGHFVFVRNSNPLVFTEKEGRIFLIDCIFDLSMNDFLFEGQITHSRCDFEVDNPITHVFSKHPEKLCSNKFKKNIQTENEEEQSSKIWYFVAVAVCIIAIAVLFVENPFQNATEENVPFLSQKEARKFH